MQRHLVSGLIVSAGLLASATAAAQAGSNDGPGPSGVIITGALADLSVTGKGTPLNGAGGVPLTYTVVVANNGPSPAAGVTLTNDIPANTTFSSLTSPASWNCATPPVGSTGTVLCTRGVVPVADSSRFTLVVTVDVDSPPTRIANVAAVSSLTTDPARGNNSATVGISAPVSLQSFGVD